MTTVPVSPESQPPKAPPRGFLANLEDQFGFRQLVSDYLIPVESNSIWYLLGGVLAIGLALEIFTGFLLSLVYTPDAGEAYGITQNLIATPGWSIVINFHYYNAFVIFGLVLLHMVRVFVAGGYRHGKTGLWLVGVGLAALTFIISLTGEALHWDEVGFGVPWNVSEALNAVGLAGAFNYTTDALLAIPTATEKLAQIYALHVSIVPILLGLFIGWHYLLIRFKGISTPFWHRTSGRTAAFTEHIRGWLIWSAIILGIVLLISIFLPARRRSCTPAPAVVAALRDRRRPGRPGLQADLPDQLDPRHEHRRREPRDRSGHLGRDHRDGAAARRPRRDPVRRPWRQGAGQRGRGVRHAQAGAGVPRDGGLLGGAHRRRRPEPDHRGGLTRG